MRRRLRPGGLLTTVLTTLAGDVWIKMAFVLVKGMGTVVHARLSRAALVLAWDVLLDAHVIVLGWIGRIGPVWLHGIGRAFVANIFVIVAASILIDPRIVAVDVAVDNFVVCAPGIFARSAAGSASGTGPIVARSIVPGSIVAGPVVTSRPVSAGAAPVDALVVLLNVVVVRVPVNVIVAIDVVDVDRTIDHRSIDGDVGVAVVDVNVVADIDVLAAAADPAAIPAASAPTFTSPAGVIDPAPAAAVSPAKIEVEPGADGKADAKGDRGAIVRAAIINNRGIIDGDIDVLRLVGRNGDVVVVLENFLLGGGVQIASMAS